jgi:SAM-dependent methyltransferase
MKPNLPMLLAAALSVVFPFTHAQVERDESFSLNRVRDNQPSLDVIYVPTPNEVVHEMLRLAKVGADDVVYDLGSGDGRIVVTAAQRYGARGVGVELDPQRLREAEANARRAQVEDKVEFRQQDLFEADLSDATVVTLYLLESLNIRLRPKLLEELAPGTPIVSHAFSMGDWRPERLQRVKVGQREYTVYLWTVPARIEGEWTWEDPLGNQPVSARLDQQYSTIFGELTAGGETSTVRQARVNGPQVRIEAQRQVEGRSVPVLYQGEARGDEIVGTVTVRDGATPRESPWRATRSGEASEGLARESGK